ncbi:MAG TPA: MarR family winged helix-turn-helix transcriptional regulator [Candidatus Saccharimonadales bacterium]|nr:MarR family winged helix-turn-helix transcriptional regulator [Candidatus Saccharimonadales bacterium]
MDNDAMLIYADHAGRFYTRQYGFNPVAARLLGYLSVCDPMEQSINDLADALLTSRSAITSAVTMLENIHLIQRSRPAGSRVDLISIDLNGATGSKAFDIQEYAEQGRLAREGLELLKDASPERRRILEEIRNLSDFLVAEMPLLEEKWQKNCQALQHKNKED